MELMKAHNQWSTRPDDERFTSLQDLHDACKRYAENAREKAVSFGDLRVEADQGEVRLVGKQGVGAKLTHWAFGQLCTRISAPASYLRDLPATLAGQNLNHGLAKVKAEYGDKVAKLLFNADENGLLLRALTSDEYARIWNWEVAERLLDLPGYEVARPDIRVQDDRLPLYASDHDMFAFLRSKDQYIDEGNTALWLGLIAENSEVGASSLKVTRFRYREMCGNHIIWGASKVIEVGLRHIGKARERWQDFAVQVREWADESETEEWNAIIRAKTTVISDTKEGVLDALFGKRIQGLTRKAIAAGYDACVPDEDGEANTVWGMVNGLTRYSQTIPQADVRTAVDKAAGKLMEVVF